ncbi:hypothetical protein KGA66_06030 [Actinocrinis puniceicyclus]|uniref:Uncharacterized protein n=1 Tax=Actinocrinis puniceicyclus TaxID=977794 RepID=A0A8J7WMS7_9ACTN|nr:hypothetical protein [Actinocrinis puniceicyclus]MBS2962597.1 hypothetical protein [Actinocrinis puniceicyclus]
MTDALVSSTPPPGKDEPPNTWPGNDSVFSIGPDEYAVWETERGTGKRIGLHTWHWDQANGHWCGGWLGFTNVEGHPPRSKHELVREDPLTVAPSLLCSRCQHHGWIRDGQWVPA